MFGYIRPVQGELLVKEYELYRAAYCGICRYGGRNISHFTRFFLNYDFVALAILRIAVTGEKASVCRKRCPYRFKKRNTLEAEEAYGLTCAAFAVLLYYKVLDDIKDSNKKGIKRFLKRLTLPFFARIKKQVKDYDDLEQHIRTQLDRLNILENQSSSGSLDETADCFASVTQYIAAYGLEGQRAVIASQCGYHIGRYVYILDALDDIDEDNKTGNFNPLIKKYGSVEEVIRNADEIETTITDSINAFSSVFGLVTVNEESSRVNDYDNIIYNICELGGRAALNRVLLSLTNSQRTKGDITK